MAFPNLFGPSHTAQALGGLASSHEALAKAVAGMGGGKSSPSIGRFATEKFIDHTLNHAGGLFRDVHAQHLAAKLGPHPVTSAVTNAALVGGGMAAAAGANYALQSHAINSSYSKMLQLYPELQRENPERVKTYFDSIAQGSPDLASNPLVCGSLVKRMLNYDGFDHATFNDLVSTQSSIDKARSEGFKNTVTMGTHGMSTLGNYGVNMMPRVR